MLLPCTDNDRRLLIAQLRRDEGSKRDSRGNHVAYLDSNGILTIGYGHNCVSSPLLGIAKPGDTITDERANAVFERDLTEHIDAVRKAGILEDELDPARQAVLYNMAYNLGIRGLLSFSRTLALVREGLFFNAAKEMLSSRWAAQVKGRARRLARQMETGEWQ